MIHGISGKSGGGKSYEAVVSHIIPIVTKDKRKVVTNLPLNVDHFVAIYGEYCRDLIEVVDGKFHNYGEERPFSKIEHYTRHKDWKNEKGQRVYFFIDECHLVVPKGSTDKLLVQWYSMARHSGYDIMLITQNFRKVDYDVKDNIGNHYRAIKKSMMGQDDKYILKVHDGHSSSNASVVATHERIYEKKYFNFYISHTDSDSAVDEATSNDIEKWYKHWSIKASVVFFAVFIFSIISKIPAEEIPKASPKLKNVEQLHPLDEQIEPNQLIESSKKPKSQLVKRKTQRQIEYEEMVAVSSSFHPFYKVDLSISGFAEYIDFDRPTRTHYFSASQNGQHVFTIKTGDLLLAGYEVQILGECAARIKYYDYVDFITCNAPTQSVSMAGDELALNN